MFTTDNETLNKILNLVRDMVNGKLTWNADEYGGKEISRHALEELESYINELDKEND